MELASLYVMLKDTISVLAEKDPYFKALPQEMDKDLALNDVGLDIVTLPEVAEELKSRLGGRNLGLEPVMNPQQLNAMTIGQLLTTIHASLSQKKPDPLVVYVDDEEENIFVFKRKFGKRLNLKTFTDPVAALAFIRADDKVALVITDEVMPKLSGNELCDEVHKVKPFMKFVLITGNPNNEGDLMYRALRKNRFYDFINKPVDFDKYGEEYFLMFQGLISFEW
jgi:CheY-like chemotaxis protein